VDWLNDMRVMVTVASFLAFVAVVLWAYAPALRKRFDDNAGIPFLDDEKDLIESGQPRKAEAKAEGN